MNRRKNRETHLDVDLSSFADIAFLLIIFFILTTSLVRPFGRGIDFPSAVRPPVEDTQDKSVSVSILSDRILLTEGGDSEQEVTLTALRAALFERCNAAVTDQDRMVLVEIAEDVAYERYFQVVTLIAEVGGVVAILTD